MPFTTTLPQSKEPEISGHINGFGRYAIDAEEKCPSCGRAGIVYMPERVKGCLHCRNLDLSGSKIFYDDTEKFHDILKFIAEELPKVKARIRERLEQ